MKKIIYFFGIILLFGVAGCDLQPKITAIPENVGDFISSRYPALLADPKKEPEIYNSAASDYGVYESADMYGSGNIDDYVLYADADDYSKNKQLEIITEKTMEPVKPDVKPKAESESKPAEIKPGPEIKPESNAPVIEEKPDYLNVPKYKEFEKPVINNEIVVGKGDTLYSLSRKYKVEVKDLANANKLSVPYSLRVGQKLKLKNDVIAKNVTVPVMPMVQPQNKVPEITPVSQKIYQLTEITVSKKDTLYSLSRKYEIPVNDLAVINKLSAPFSLSVGQKLKVPKLNEKIIVSVPDNKNVISENQVTKSNKILKNSKDSQPKEKIIPEKKEIKISSNPAKVLPKITARSSSKFTWPVRGKILSGFGAKSNGLYNDGINIGGGIGKPVSAAENGVVAYAGNEVKGMGNLIIIQHSDGWMTVYAHLDSMIVRRGIKVSVGQKIGTVGKTGKVDIPQLHFEIRKGTKAYNPESKLK